MITYTFQLHYSPNLKQTRILIEQIVWTIALIWQNAVCRVEWITSSWEMSLWGVLDGHKLDKLLHDMSQRSNFYFCDLNLRRSRISSLQWFDSIKFNNTLRLLELETPKAFESRKPRREKKLNEMKAVRSFYCANVQNKFVTN